MKKLVVLIVMLSFILAACGTEDNNNSNNHHAKSDSHGGHGSHEENTQSNHGTHDNTSEAAQSNIEVKWSYDEAKLKPETEIVLRAEVVDDNGSAVEKFDINHEKLYHLIVVSEDLSFFDHLHPEYKGKGIFEVSLHVPSSGRYKLVSDMIPTAAKQVTDMKWLEIQGEEHAHHTGGHDLEPDAELVQVKDGKQVTLTLSSQESGKDVELKFNIVKEADGAPITNLEPYLGAVGHVVILSEDTEQYLHVHPMDESAAGPDAVFMTAFPKAGLYKIWGQFQHEGKVFTVPYVVEIQ